VMEKVLVVPWGNPFGWREITYVYEGVVKENILCTLPILKDKIKPDRIIIIVLDTLANVNFGKEVNEQSYAQQNFSSYDEIKEDVTRRVEYFIEKKLGEDLEGLELVIAPGVGVFGNIKVEGNMLDYYHYVTYELAKRLPNENMTVYLDLTHGINFMPVLTYRALLNLLGLASYIKYVRFRVLNSEPFPYGVPQEEVCELKLNVRVVEDREVRPKPILSLLNDEKFSRWNAFISSVANGFPLVFTTFYPKIVKIESEIKRRLQSFYRNISVDDRFVVRKSELDSDFKTLSKLYYLLRVLDSLLRVLNTKLPKKELTLDELKSISETLFNKLPRIGVIVEEQIKSLEDKFTTDGKPKSFLRGVGWKPLAEYLSSSWISGSDATGKSRAIRNFIAHSGFEYNVTMVKGNFGTVLFKYKSKEELVVPYSIESLQFRLKDGD